MSVQYKSADGWKNISSSSNNTVDTVENGNMNPVTFNAVTEYTSKSFMLLRNLLRRQNKMELLVSYILGLLTLPVILVLVCAWQAIFEDE